MPPNAGTVGQFGTTVAGRSPLSHDLKIDPAESEDWTMAEESKPAEVSRKSKHRRPSFSRSWRIRNVRGFRWVRHLRGRSSTVPSRWATPSARRCIGSGDDYLMLNYVVEFEPDRRIFWEPAPGDPSRAEDNDPSKVGIPAGYRWGYILTPDGDDATVVTEVFDSGPLPEDLLLDGGAWINGTNPVLESMAASLGETREDQYRVGPLPERPYGSIFRAFEQADPLPPERRERVAYRRRMLDLHELRPSGNHPRCPSDAHEDIAIVGNRRSA